MKKSKVIAVTLLMFAAATSSALKAPAADSNKQPAAQVESGLGHDSGEAEPTK